MRLAIGEKIIKSSRPNRHFVALIEGGEGDNRYYYVHTSMAVVHDEPMEDDYDCEDIVEAARVYEREVKDLSSTGNPQAQAEYDDAHGTVNGYAPWQYSASEY
jgi:hypothetical protein